MKEGREENQKKQKDIIINMHKKHMEISDICEIVELTKEEVERIIKENEKVHESK